LTLHPNWLTATTIQLFANGVERRAHSLLYRQPQDLKAPVSVGTATMSEPQKIKCLRLTIMSLIQSARLNDHDPYVYLKDVLTRLPTQRSSEIDQLLPHKWQSA
jgi:hypothetical protein